MTMVRAEDLLIQVFVLVDDWYRAVGFRLRSRLPGPSCASIASEMLTLLLVMDYFPYDGEQQFLCYIRVNYLPLFPALLEQSQFNRRARRLSGLLEAPRRYWLSQLHVTDEDMLMLDTKPVPVVGYKRSKRYSDFEGSASYGYCASRKLNYFGYKLVMLTTLSGIPLVYDVVPANTDERAAAETVLVDVHRCTIFADKGFIGTD
ncbi:MAG: transposase [Cyanobacteria bacterium P01_D01_bin.1]